MTDLDIFRWIHNHIVVDSLSATLTALSDPTRRSILDRLLQGEVATVGELAAPFRISQQAVSKHLALLERARLIRKRRLGRRHVCAVDPAPLRELGDWMARYRAQIEQSFDRLDDYLRRLQTAAGDAPTDPPQDPNR